MKNDTERFRLRLVLSRAQPDPRRLGGSGTLIPARQGESCDLLSIRLSEKSLDFPALVRTMYVPMRRRISTSGNSAALVLSQDILGLMGIGAGDEVDVSLIDRTLVVRPISEAERSAKVQKAIDEVFRRDATLLRRLAEGVGPDETIRKK